MISIRNVLGSLFECYLFVVEEQRRGTDENTLKDSWETITKLKQEISDLEDEEKQLDLDKAVVCRQIKEITENKENRQYALIILIYCVYFEPILLTFVL